MQSKAIKCIVNNFSEYNTFDTLNHWIVKDKKTKIRIHLHAMNCNSQIPFLLIDG